MVFETHSNKGGRTEQKPADEDDSQVRIDDFGGTRLVTDGGYESGHEAVQDEVDNFDGAGGDGDIAVDYERFSS